jgi:UDP-N-acetylmuramoyl-L-alanyl-D-glutamate--2,6-diaminopimelate ligase
VLIAGKGHETYQIFRDRTIHFDDREVARGVLRGFGFQKKEPA